MKLETVNKDNLILTRKAARSMSSRLRVGAFSVIAAQNPDSSHRSLAKKFNECHKISTGCLVQGTNWYFGGEKLVTSR